MKSSLRGPLIFMLGVTFSGFLFSLHYTKIREYQLTAEIPYQAVSDSVALQKSVTVAQSRLVPSTSKIDELPRGSTAVPLPKKEEDCNCVSQKTGHSHNFCYMDPQNVSSIGKQFSCNHLATLERLKLVDNTGPFIDLSNTAENTKEVIFVSAVSDNHFNEATASIDAFYKFYPRRRFILYSLGLGEIYITNIKKDFKYLEVRVFNTSRYPEYVTHWMTYRFKPLILAEVMTEFTNIWWMDAHIVTKKPNMIETFYKELEERTKKNDTDIPVPIYFFIHASHSNFATLFPQVLTYFPSNSQALLKSEQHGSQLGANTFFVGRTEYAVEIFKWWILCALDKTCMAPPGAQVLCSFKEDRNKEFANCFRFDQSILNLLMLNHYQDHLKYFTPFKPLIMAEMLMEFRHVWWIDAHMKMVLPIAIGSFFDEVARNQSTDDDYSSITSFSNSNHSNFATLVPGLLEYFPSNSLNLLKSSYQVQAGIIYFSRTEKTMEIFKWFVLCALDEDCMSHPAGTNFDCYLGPNRMEYFANCFRYDQSSTDELSSLVESQKVSFEKVNSPSVVAPIETSKNLKTTSKSASPKPPIPRETKLKSPTNCVCKSEKSGKPHSFCYVDPQNQTSIGKKFDCSHLNILESLGLVNNPGPFVDLKTFEKDSSEIVFVSATSDNHIKQAIESIASFYKFNPAGKYILYSLALYSYQIKRIQSKLKNLEIRTFNTTGYPSYVTHWKEYRFKSLIIAEVMKEYSNIWWLDANIRVEKGNLTELLREEMGDFVEKRGVENTSSVFSFVYTGHSNFPVLFPDLLTYFPTNSIPLLKNVKHGSQLGANAVFFAKTKFTMEVLKWWVLCSLDKTCMNPPGAQVSCHFDTDRNNKFAHCFRFDQSVLNLLLLNRFQDNNKYFSKLGYLFSRTS
ncbi:hypothetical protein L5515_005867 [Caenorhabditis briggsae]|uniref:Uncharacterized protein n=1 Tax=Caenorhabditis briggsae TaxID=6238 RepID=A0AAE9JK47_CAEBR|nr:hypothetical protein L5515_005867 [Caenorhabditis briggsae]